MAMQPTFDSLSDETGLDIVDPIETRHFSLFTDAPVEPTEADPEAFAFPVASACRIRTDRLRLPYMVPLEVRDPNGDHRDSVDLPTTREFPADEYLLELHSPIKVYLRVTTALTVEATEDDVTMEFDGEVPVEVGARSYHSSPAATITVPDDPEALMAAVSAFPSALKTTSPERSWPTLRGHPPRIERGDELSIPDGLDAPDTGITVEVPPEYAHVYAVAPLAFYLGAEVVPGETARLTAESGVSRNLGEDVSAVADSAKSLLKRNLFLDCVTRTEGLYPDDLHEREVLESHADLDFAALYEAPPDERLAAYLDVPDEAVEAIESPWHRVTHVQPSPDAAELLPYVVHDLSLVEVAVSDGESWTPTESQQQTDEALSDFVRRATPARDGDFLRSAEFRRSAGIRRSGTRRNDGVEDEQDESSNSARGIPGEGGYMPLPETDALEQAWVGDRTPVQGTKLLKEAFEHDTAASEDGTVEITVVCNDEDMREELDSAAEIYANREYLRADVTCEFGVTTDELRDLLAQRHDMFHFIGHIDGLGFQCPDGILDAGTLDETGAKTVLLNGCRSHDQGVELVKSGARAAVVSLADLWNVGAVEVGETLAGLLRNGFGIGAAVEIVREYTSLGNQYIVLGDPKVAFNQNEYCTPTLYHLSNSNVTGGDEVLLEPYAFPPQMTGIGSITRPPLKEFTQFYFSMGKAGERTIRSERLQEGLNASEPFIIGNELIWNDDWDGSLER